jgi:hypothetical protein
MKGEKLIDGLWSNPFAYGLFRLATAENGKPCLEQEQTIPSRGLGIGIMKSGSLDPDGDIGAR